MQARPSIVLTPEQQTLFRGAVTAIIGLFWLAVGYAFLHDMRLTSIYDRSFSVPMWSCGSPLLVYGVALMAGGRWPERFGWVASRRVTKICFAVCAGLLLGIAGEFAKR